MLRAFVRPSTPLALFAFLAAAAPAPARADDAREDEAPAPTLAAPPPSAAPAPPVDAGGKAVRVEPSSGGPSAPAAAPVATEDGLARTRFFRFALGGRFGLVGSDGYDPFSTNDALSQLSLEATATFASAGRFTFATGVGWDVGGSSATTRGADASVTVHRFALPLEGRLHAATGFYAFARFAPGLLVQRARLEGGTRDTLAGGAVGFGGDLSVGASLLAFPRNRPDRRGARFWITPEVGYALTTAQRPSLAPQHPDDRIGEAGALELPAFGQSGPFFRVMLALTY